MCSSGLIVALRRRLCDLTPVCYQWIIMGPFYNTLARGDLLLTRFTIYNKKPECHELQEVRNMTQADIRSVFTSQPTRELVSRSEVYMEKLTCTFVQLTNDVKVKLPVDTLAAVFCPSSHTPHPSLSGEHDCHTQAPNLRRHTTSTPENVLRIYCVSTGRDSIGRRYPGVSLALSERSRHFYMTKMRMLRGDVSTNALDLSCV